jgi:hypothetical protein
MSIELEFNLNELEFNLNLSRRSAKVSFGLSAVSEPIENYSRFYDKSTCSLDS